MAPGHWELRTEMGKTDINCSVQFNMGRAEGGTWPGKDSEKRGAYRIVRGLNEIVCLEHSFYGVKCFF